jgi:uncharacterized membrane protein
MTRRNRPHWLMALLSILALFSLAISAPASAHEKHKKKEEAAQQAQQQASPGARTSEAMQGGATAAHGQMGEEMEGMDEDRSNMSFAERLLDWIGRLHPAIVHFPIAFFPAALFTAIVGRRRPTFATPVQFLVVAGGIIAPIAAVLGWFDAMNADPDPLLSMHRWLGTAIGIGALGLGVWAWRRPDQDRSTGMIIALAVITAAIVIQGWYGGAMVHGIEHMNW